MTLTNNINNQFYYDYAHNQLSLNEGNSQLNFNHLMSMKLDCYKLIQKRIFN